MECSVCGDARLVMPCFGAMRALQSGTDSRQHVCVRNAILMQSTVSVVRLQKASPFLVSVHASSAKMASYASSRLVLAQMVTLAGMALRTGRGSASPRSGQLFGRSRDRINCDRAAKNRSPYAQNSGSSMPDWTSLLGCAGGAVLVVSLIRYYRDHYTRSGWLRSGQEASHRLHRA